MISISNDTNFPVTHVRQALCILSYSPIGATTLFGKICYLHSHCIMDYCMYWLYTVEARKQSFDWEHIPGMR